MNFIRRLFRKEDDFDKLPKLMNEFGEILHKIHDEVDHIYKQPVIKSKKTFEVKELIEIEGKVINKQQQQKFRKALHSLADKIEKKLKPEINNLTEALSKKSNNTTEYGTVLFFYRHYKQSQKQKIKHHLRIVRTLKRRTEIISVRIDLAVLELKTPINILHDLSFKMGFNEEIINDIEKQLDKIDANVNKIQETLEKLISELNLLKK